MDSVQSQLKAQLPRITVRAFVLRHIASLALLPILALGGAAHAVSLGDIVLQSHLGEPLKAKIALSIGSSESIDESCLSLTTPSNDLGNPDDFITQATLSLHQDGRGNAQVLIRGSQPLQKVFVRLQLQVRCPGQGSVNRTFTVLPTLESASAPSTEPSPIQSPATGTSTPIKTRAATVTAPPPAKSRHSPPVYRQPVQTKEDRSAPITRKAPEIGEFHLRLSTDVIDTSRIGKLSETERNKLLAQQSQLDQDDQTANILALQHQIKQLQDELKLVRIQMGQPLPVSSVAAQPVERAQAASAPKAKPVSTPPVVAPAAGSDNDLMYQIAFALGAILLMLLGLRLYKQRIKAQWTGESIAVEEVEAHPPVFPPQLAKVAETAHAQESAPAEVVPAPEIRVTESVTAIPDTNTSEPPKESDWVIEEAELYAVHGHPELAIQILEKLLEQSPDKPQAWLLLLSILSSLDRRPEFEDAAHRFAAVDDRRVYWKEVQALGQRIDKDNPLYFGEIGEVHEPVPLPKTQHRPLGAILLDTGALTEEVLMGVLAQFNPKRDGRIGAFLIQHGLISHEQLEDALQIQRIERASSSDQVG